ncbi:MAG: DNA-directed RNA polymerase subunit omega [Firmicutes bacterium]|nr:DNA-directed RNA polymerase subunit omega [Bacillota bacterium]
MLYPSIDKLLNIVDSKYMLVHVASKRSKQMLETSHYQMRISDYISKKDIGKSLEELENGLIKVIKK